MKKIFSCLLVVVMLSALLVVGVSAAEKTNYLACNDYGEIAQVEKKTIRLDGEKDEAYDAAAPIAIGTVYAPTSNTTTSTDTTATSYVVYDGQYIWVFVEVNDTTLKTHAPNSLESSFREDSVEILIDWGNAGLDIANKAPYQCRLSHEGYISARLGQSGTSMFGSVEDGGTNPVTWLNGTSKVRADGTGYNCEFRIAIPEEVEVGERIGINFTLNDWKDQGVDRFIITSDPNVAVREWTVANIGYMTLNAVPYTADTTIIYVVIAMVAALAIGGATLVSLKKKAK